MSAFPDKPRRATRFVRPLQADRPAHPHSVVFGSRERYRSRPRGAARIGTRGACGDIRSAGNELVNRARRVLRARRELGSGCLVKRRSRNTGIARSFGKHCGTIRIEREPRLWHGRLEFQMFKRLAVAFAIALLAVPSVAQPSASTPISGVVVDADTRAPIRNATVSAGAAHVSADAAGRFTLLVEGGRVTLLVEASGYFALITTLEIPEAGLFGAELALAGETPFATSVAVTASAPSTTSIARSRPCRAWRRPRSLAAGSRSAAARPIRT
jgi:hypothetical protein